MRTDLGKNLTRAERTRLVAALEKQHVATVQKFLKVGWNPAELLNGENPLSYCDSAGFAKLLIAAGADVNAGENNWTPLLVNCDTGKKDIVALLIRSGADVNRAYSKRGDPQIPLGTTPLMKAAGHGHLEIIKRLLGAGADVNALDEHRHNALFRALYWDRAKAAVELIKKGSKLTKDALGGPVVHGNVKLVR